MLSLKRIPGERIVIGRDITVTVVSVKGRVVLLGIDAPHDVRVDRQEVRTRIDREAERTVQG